MSKCSEAYELHAEIHWNPKDCECRLWQAAWNARGKVDIELCNAQADMSDWPEKAYFCAEAIEQEQCK